MNIDNDELEKVANHLYSLSDDCPAELRQGIATVRQIVNEEFVAKCETIGSQTIWKLLKPHIDNLLAAQGQALRDEVLEALPDEEDYLTAPGSTGDAIDAWNKYRTQAIAAISTIFEDEK